MLTRTLKSFAAEIETTRTDLAALIAKRDTFGAGRLVHKLVGFGDTAYMTFHKEHRAKIESTTPIKRLNGEIKCRTDVVGIFPE